MYHFLYHATIDEHRRAMMIFMGQYLFLKTFFFSCLIYMPSQSFGSFSFYFDVHKTFDMYKVILYLRQGCCFRRYFFFFCFLRFVIKSSSQKRLLWFKIICLWLCFWFCWFFFSVRCCYAAWLFTLLIKINCCYHTNTLQGVFNLNIAIELIHKADDKCWVKEKSYVWL